MTAEELRNSILSAPKNGYSKLTAEQRKEMEAYALRYRAFMDACKTEREATAWATAMAEKHGLSVMMTNALPNAVRGRVADLSREGCPAAVNLEHCLLAGDIPTGEELKSARALLLSAPLKDDFGQMIDAHAPLHASPLAPRIAALLRGLPLDRYDFVCLDGDYTRFDEMYLDRLWLNESAE